MVFSNTETVTLLGSEAERLVEHETRLQASSTKLHAWQFLGAASHVMTRTDALPVSESDRDWMSARVRGRRGPRGEREVPAGMGTMSAVSPWGWGPRIRGPRGYNNTREHRSVRFEICCSLSPSTLWRKYSLETVQGESSTFCTAADGGEFWHHYWRLVCTL